MSALRHDARSLFAAAREDGPASDERDAVFRRVALATGISAGAAAVAVASPGATAAPAAVNLAATSSAISIKVLAIGALIGAASTALGVVLAVTLVMPDSPAPSRVDAAPLRGPVDTGPAPAARMHTAAPGAKLAAPGARSRDPAEAEAKARALVDLSTRAEAIARAEASARAEPPSDLAEEARLVTAARTALVAGDSARALALVQATRRLSARALEPEELGLEARALRALGRADEAAVTELVLRRRYPESALAR